MIDSVVYNVVHERDWRRDGRSFADLWLAGTTPEQIRSYVKTSDRADA